MQWELLAGMVGTPVVMGPACRRLRARMLGITIGAGSNLPDNGMTSYDLLKIGCDVQFGAAAAVHCFATTREGELHGSCIVVENGVFAGTTSDILPASTIGENAIVAAYSVAMGEVPAGHVVVDTIMRDKFAKNVDTGARASWVIKESVVLMVNISQWALVGGLAATGVYAMGDSLASGDLKKVIDVGNYPGLGIALLLAGAFGAGVWLALPMMLTSMWVMSKLLIIGTYEPGSYPAGTWGWIRFVYVLIIHFSARTIFGHQLGGSFLELLVYRALGVNIGSNVHLDFAVISEQDMVMIENGCTVLGPAGLSPHNIYPDRVTIQKLIVRRGSAIAEWSCLHGGDEMEAGSTLDAMSQPVIGTTLTRGRWRGYPSRRVGPEPPAPPPPPLPQWYHLLSVKVIIFLLRVTLLTPVWLLMFLWQVLHRAVAHVMFHCGVRRDGWVSLWLTNSTTKNLNWNRSREGEIVGGSAVSTPMDDVGSTTLVVGSTTGGIPVRTKSAAKLPRALHGTFEWEDDGVLLNFAQGAWDRDTRSLKVGLACRATPSNEFPEPLRRRGGGPR